MYMQRYKILNKPHGKGGQGLILRAYDKVLRRDVALKVFESGRRSLREAVITAKLQQHQGIVPVFEYGEHEGVKFYAMMLINGRSFREILNEIATSIRQDDLTAEMTSKGRVAKRLAKMLTPFREACATVAYAHKQGAIHRDLKPENMMLCEEDGVEGRTFVIDWGLAGFSPKAKMTIAAVDEETSGAQQSVSLSITASGECLGTPPYMSPEQAGCKDIDERADVWGLGTILFEILTGSPPYLGKTREEIIEKIRTTPAPHVFDLEPAAPAALVTIVNAAMARDRQQRKISAKEIERKIKAYQFTGLLKDYAKQWARSLLHSF